MISDEAVVNAKDDRLGFAATAHHLASAFLQNDLSRGFVVGVEGPWGSGKSSLVNMALDELEKKEEGPRVVRFAPWLVGSRNELLTQFFADLEPAVLKALPASDKEDAKRILESYSQISAGLATLADFAELGGMPLASFVGKSLRISGKKAKQLSERSLGELRRDLRTKLGKLDRPVVVFIDDLDRLEPREVCEVLRLVKAVADFPNVAYILAYDPDVVAANVKEALGTSNGKSYLEKVVQASFKVPKAISYDLRNWLKDEVSALIDERELPAQAIDRLENTYDRWAYQFLETPRDVVRVVNSLRLNFIPVRENVDPGDMIFLEIVRTKNNNLFRWIEGYVANLSAILDWGYTPPDINIAFEQSLSDIAGNNQVSGSRLIRALAQQLPGIDAISMTSDKQQFQLFTVKNIEALREYIRDKRLASPAHYGYYFSFANPSGSLPDNEVEMFLRLCEYSHEKAISTFRHFIELGRPQGGRMAEVLLERIIVFREKISAAQLKGLFRVLGEAIDELLPFVRRRDGKYKILDGNRKEIFGLIEMASENERVDLLAELFTEAKSFAWLSGIIRASSLQPSWSESKGSSIDGPLFSEDDFNMISEIFDRRLSNLGFEALQNKSCFLDIMTAWFYTGKIDSCLDWIRRETKDDEVFVELLQLMKSWTNSTAEGVRYRFQADTLVAFFGGVMDVYNRLQEISSSMTASESLKRKAKELYRDIDSLVT